MTIAIKITGPCDTTGCPYPATTHYGLEEFYCDSCHLKNAATHRRWEQEYKDRVTESKWLTAIFDATWPKACRSCDVSGVVIFYESHGMPGPGEQITDPCEKCEGRCPRCAYEVEVEEIPEAFEAWWSDSMPCPSCGWKWGINEGDTRPVYQGP